ncbi:MAG: LysR family transcriptional regulator ArgP [Pseudomonadota bacterium]
MFDYQTMRALSAISRTGSFDKAAQHLGVTASAISQRIKTLEDRLGTVLIKRGNPCVPTAAGRRLVQHADDVALLEHAVARDLGHGPHDDIGATTIRLAVNADSLATWFVTAMAAVDDGLLYDVVVDDQDYSADWLARGEVVAAVSGEPRAIQGCDVQGLGALRYTATASPSFAAQWFPDGVTIDALSRAPCMVFNTKDGLQREWVKRVTGADVVMPTHWLPSTQAFVDGAVAGLGWGVNPEPLMQGHVTAGRLVTLQPQTMLDVPLYWHVSRLAAPALAGLTAAVVQTAARCLRPLHPA